jgi:putative acetyltransferase
VIREARAEDIPEIREIFREYAAWVGDAICLPSFEREVAGLPGAYALYVAVMDDRLAGCAALRKPEPGFCEMKRLYVRPEFQGAGLGRLLIERIIAEARAAGYRFLRLDTLPRMERAIALYRSFGFREIPSYGENPTGAICFELALFSRRVWFSLRE